MRIIAAFQKDKGISYTSHLDVQRTLQRAFRRAGLPLAYSNGYNPHPKLSFATALATGFTSDAEWIEVELEREIAPDRFLSLVNGALPNGMRIATAFAADETIDTLSKMLCAARYTVTLVPDMPVERAQAEAALQALLASEEVIVEKKTKSGIKPANIRPDILEASVSDDADAVRMELVGILNVAGGLRVETFVRALYERLGVSGFATVHRSALYFTGSDRLPCLAEKKGFEK